MYHQRCWSHPRYPTVCKMNKEERCMCITTFHYLTSKRCIACGTVCSTSGVIRFSSLPYGPHTFHFLAPAVHNHHFI